MGRSVSHPNHATWVLFAEIHYDYRQVFVCRKCNHHHYDLDSAPVECMECGNTTLSAHEDYPLDLQWDDFVTHLREAFKTSFPSLHDCSTPLDREGRAILENVHAWIGVSKYCNMASIWCVHKEHDGEEDGLHRQWAQSIQSKAERILENRLDGTRVYRVVQIAQSYPVFARVEHHG